MYLFSKTFLLCMSVIGDSYLKFWTYHLFAKLLGAFDWIVLLIGILHVIHNMSNKTKLDRYQMFTILSPGK